MFLQSKLPQVGTTIFTVMSRLAQEHGAINLSQGFPDFDTHPRLPELYSRFLFEGKNQYAPMAGLPELRERLAEKISCLYGTQPDPEDEITITAGGTQGLFTAIAALVRPGDEVIYPEPAYDAYRPAVELFGGIAKPMVLNGPDYAIDWSLFRRMLTANTRMVIINTPNNPTGRIFSDDDMQQLSRELANTEVVVLSDEVYEHLVFDGEQHRSILSYPELRRRGFAVFSFGKTYHVTGWKTGYVVAPPGLSAEFRKVHQFNVFSVNTPLQYALAEFLDDPGQYLTLPAFYGEKRDFFLDQIRGTGLKPLPCQGTYFQCCDYTGLSDKDDVAFSRWLLTEVGVAAVPISAFHHQAPEAGILRFCFAKREETLEAAGQRLRRLVG